VIFWRLTANFTEDCQADVKGGSGRYLLYRGWEPSAFCYRPPYCVHINVWKFRVRVY